MVVAAVVIESVDEPSTYLMICPFSEDGAKHDDGDKGNVTPPFRGKACSPPGEARAVEAEVVIALKRLRGRCVMVGDPRRLPATVFQRPGTAFGRSLFERLQEGGLPVNLLTTQYRMHPSISFFPPYRSRDGHPRNSGRDEYLSRSRSGTPSGLQLIPPRRRQSPSPLGHWRHAREADC